MLTGQQFVDEFSSVFVFLRSHQQDLQVLKQLLVIVGYFVQLP